VRAPVTPVALSLCVALPSLAAGAEVAQGVTGRARRPHALYVELMGKGGLYSVGYDYALLPWLAAGSSLSYLQIDGQHIVTLSPYVNLYPVGGAVDALLLQLGPQLVHLSLESEVEGWAGAKATGLGGQVSLGYEYRRRFLLRAVATLTFGQHGVAPWVGVSLGWSL
jgi:hypothetical protein